MTWLLEFSNRSASRSGLQRPMSMITSQWDSNATELELKEEGESDYYIQVNVLNVLRCTKGN